MSKCVKDETLDNLDILGIWGTANLHTPLGPSRGQLETHFCNITHEETCASVQYCSRDWSKLLIAVHDGEHSGGRGVYFCLIAFLSECKGGEWLGSVPKRGKGKLQYRAELMLVPTVVQDHAEEATMDLQPTFIAVIDKTQRPEFIHKMTDSRPGRADHLSQVVLTDAGNHCF